MVQNAVLLLSGGLDSTTLLAHAIEQGYRVHALSFRYGQRHAQEIEAARAAAQRYGVVRHEIANIDLTIFGGSALTTDMEVPKDRDVVGNVSTQDLSAMDLPVTDFPATDLPATDLPATEIPVTYVPARNTVFLAYALALAEVTDSRDIFIGVNSLDYSGYPDCRPAYIAAFEQMANLATRSGVEGRPVRIRAPFLQMTKREIISLGLSLGVDYSQTMSCYDPTASGEACGRCDACQLRLKGFFEAGMSDPARYAYPSSRVE